MGTQSKSLNQPMSNSKHLFKEIPGAQRLFSPIVTRQLGGEVDRLLRKYVVFVG